ncbi:hypothetical protein BGZ72_001904 [Mortierella alpina]|nr:hypothetical protein BGZ72_001904 [Mortierella alpina]
MRITPDPFASPSRRPTPSSSTSSLDTLVKDDSRSTTTATLQTKPAQDPSQKPPALRVKSASSAAAPPRPPSATARTNATVPEKRTSGKPLLDLDIADGIKRTPIAAKHLSRAWTPSPTFDFLTIDTHQKPLWRSQSSDGLSSPNQLEGIVIESLKTPIQGTHGCLGAAGRDTTTAGRPKDMAKGFAGEVFEPEHASIEQSGVPWMLYRHKSRSTGTIPYMHAPNSLEAASAMEAGAIVTTSAKAPRENDIGGTLPAVPVKKRVITSTARTEGLSGTYMHHSATTVANAAMGTNARDPIKSAFKPLPEVEGNAEGPVGEPSVCTRAAPHRPQRLDQGTAGGKSQPSAHRNQKGRNGSQLPTDDTDLHPAVEPPLMVRSQQPLQTQETVKPQQTIQSKRTAKPQQAVERQQIVKSQQIAEHQQTVKPQHIVDQHNADGEQAVKPQQRAERQQTVKQHQKIEGQTAESHSSPLCREESKPVDAATDPKADAPASTVLAVSTANISTALGQIQDQNSVPHHPSNQPSFNSHSPSAQQLYSRHTDTGMDASSPSTLFSHNSSVHSPAPSDTTTTSSIHTESTCISETFMTSSRPNSSSTTSSSTTTSHSSQSTCTNTTDRNSWFTTPSSTVHSDTASSVASTIYHHPHHYDRQHHHPRHDRATGFFRGYITRAQEMASTVSTTTGTATSGAFSRAQRFLQTNRMFTIFASNPSASFSSSPEGGGPLSASSPPERTAEPNMKDQPDKASFSSRWYSSDHPRTKPPPPPHAPPTSSSSSLPQPQRYIPGLNGRNGRKGPKRPDEKTFFSNERTYMHWIKFGLLLGSMALTLCSFGQEAGLGVGLFLVTVAMSTLVYATTIYHLRHRWMTRARFDVKYYDRVGPSVLFLALFMAYATNVGLTLHKLVDKQDEGLNFYNINGPMDI